MRKFQVCRLFAHQPSNFCLFHLSSWVGPECMRVHCGAAAVANTDTDRRMSRNSQPSPGRPTSTGSSLPISSTIASRQSQHSSSSLVDLTRQTPGDAERRHFSTTRSTTSTVHACSSVLTALNVRFLFRSFCLILSIRGRAASEKGECRRNSRHWLLTVLQS